MRGVGGFAPAATVCIAGVGAAAGGAVFALGLRQLPRQSHVKTEELLFPSRQTPPGLALSGQAYVAMQNGNGVPPMFELVPFVVVLISSGGSSAPESCRHTTRG